jgi:hypothetical protein
MKTITRITLAAPLILLAWTAGRAQSQANPAVPIEPVTAIVDAFRSHSVVAVTAGHGSERGYAFGLSLVRDPRFVAAVNDIVIEEGSSRYQDVADRFVRGEDVSEEFLSRVWRETTQPGLGLDRPWREFFRTVRAVNAALPRERQLRVLLGEPPIEWENVHTREDHRKWLNMRDTFPADLIEHEVLAKSRRALLTYGSGHFQRKNQAANFESEGLAETVVSRLEARTGTNVFTIWTVDNKIAKLQPDVTSWAVPSIATVRGTSLGAADVTFYASDELGRWALVDGKPDFSKQIPRDQWRTLKAEDQFDAVLYTGPEPSSTVQPLPERCADKADIEEHLRRLAMIGPPRSVEQLTQFCAGAGSRTAPAPIAGATAILDLTGKWAVEGAFDDTTLSGGGFDCAFKQDGEQLTGTCSDDPSQLTGEVKGQNVSWKLKAVTYTGTVNEAGTSIKGRFTVAGKGGSFAALKSK